MVFEGSVPFSQKSAAKPYYGLVESNPHTHTHTHLYCIFLRTIFHVALNGFGGNTNKENVENSSLLLLQWFIFLCYSFCCYGYRWLLCLPHFCRSAATSVICGIIITDGRKLKGRILGWHAFSCVHIKIHQHPSSGSWLETRVPSVITSPVWCLSIYAYCGEKTVRILCFSVQNM